MGYGRNFYGNVCRMLGTLNLGVQHKRASVSFPLSKVRQALLRPALCHRPAEQQQQQQRSTHPVTQLPLLPMQQVGLELSALLRGIGVIADYDVLQRVERVKGHARLWDPSRSHITSSAEADGYPAMALRLHLSWDAFAPLAAPMPVAAVGPPGAVPQLAAPLLTRSAGPLGALPMGLNSPVPSSVKIISSPSHQRWMTLKQLESAVRCSPPGVFLMSTERGLMTDLQARLEGCGGVVLAHLGLPLGRVAQLRGLLAMRHAAAVRSAGSSSGSAGRSSSAAAGANSRWDARADAAAIVSARLATAPPSGAGAYLDAQHKAQQDARELLGRADQRAAALARQQSALEQAPHLAQRLVSTAGGSTSSNSGGGGGAAAAAAGGMNTRRERGGGAASSKGRSSGVSAVRRPRAPTPAK